MRYPKLKPIPKSEIERSENKQRALIVLDDIEKIEAALISGNSTNLKALHMEMDGTYQSNVMNWGNGMYAFNKEFGFNYEYLGSESIIHNLNTMKGILRGYMLQLDPNIVLKRTSQKKSEGDRSYKMNPEKKRLLADYGKIKQVSAGNSAINVSNADFPALQGTLDYLSSHGFIKPLDTSSGFGRVYIKKKPLKPLLNSF